MKKLTPQQAKFVAEYLRHGEGKAAAIAAGYSEHSAASQASVMLSTNEAVKEAIAAARNTLIAEGTYNLKTAMKEAEDAMQFAKDTDNANAYTKAVELRAKLNGLLIEKHAHTMVGFSVNVGGIDFSKRDGQPQLTGQSENEVVEIEDDGSDLIE